MIRAELDERMQWVPRTEEEKDEVRRQMHRLLNTSHFKNSRRYPALFRFVVEETLEGRGEFLKERLLGVQVFNRPPDYDTATDPIVRVTIAEIRKRIAQYYHEEAHETELRIEITPGRYEPEFYPRRRPIPASADPSPLASEASHLDLPHAKAVVVLPLQTVVPEQPSQSTGHKWSALRRATVASAVLAGIAAASLALWIWLRPSAVHEFWNPLLFDHRTITFCLPTGMPDSKAAEAAGVVPYPPKQEQNKKPGDAGKSQTSQSFLDHENEGENVVFSDVMATLKISNWLAAQNRESRPRLNISTTLDDLEQGPDVLIGGLDNGWTLRTLSRMRYRFAGNGHEQYWIADTGHPGKRDWEVDLNTGYQSVKRDFALIARVHDEATGQVQVVVAGIGMTGTAAAGEFLVDPHQLEELHRRVGAGFRTHDMEAVLGMDVVNGIAGTPTILAVWVR